MDFVKVVGKHQLTFGYMGVAIDENGGRFLTTNFNFDNAFTAGPDPLNLTANTGNSIASLCWARLPVGAPGSKFHNVPRLAPWDVFAG